MHPSGGRKFVLYDAQGREPECCDFIKTRGEKNMEYKLNYGVSVLTLPRRAIENLSDIPSDYIKVLLALAGTPEWLADTESHFSSVAESCGCSQKRARSALDFWAENGILSRGEQQNGCVRAEAKEAEQNSGIADTSDGKRAVKAKKPELPAYTAEEISRMMDSDADLRPLVNECEQLMGKIFSEYEVASILGMHDYLGLDAEFILLLVDYCSRRGKKSMRYLERTALGMTEEGIQTTEALEAKLKSMDKLEDDTYRIKKMFGMGDRALTAKEKKWVENWCLTWQMPFELIEYAYELTIGGIGKPSAAYVNAILERWHAAGYRTKDEVSEAKPEHGGQSTPPERESGEKKRGGKKASSADGPGFDIDEFLELALKRSFSSENE